MNRSHFVKRATFATAWLSAQLVFLGGLAEQASAQDSAPDNREPIDASINPLELSYDILVDADLLADDPQNHRFKTLQAAYDAATAGTADDPTVIGIRPNVYHLEGGKRRARLRIEKDNITLLGLANNRRAVVLADNRGLQQGAENNGYVLDVKATGFTCRNLTIVNHCNLDYEYPGDPSRNLAKRTDVATQAVALSADGDRHVYENVALLGRLGTLSLHADRAYFKNVFIEGTDDWIGGNGIGVWEDCTLVFPEGDGAVHSMNNVFVRCHFHSGRGFQFYKVDSGSHRKPSVLIDCTISLCDKEGRVAWMREEAPKLPNLFSLTWNLRDGDGNPITIRDSSVGEAQYLHSREISAEELKAFNPWNLLRAVPGREPDNWDPTGAGLKPALANEGALPFRIVLVDASPEGNNAPRGYYRIRTSGPGATIGAELIPTYAENPAISWTTDSDLVQLDQGQGAKVVATGSNNTEHAAWVPIKASAANGLHAVAWVYVEPEYIAPPKFVEKPQMLSAIDGKIEVSYLLDLDGRRDESIVTWSVCDDALGLNERTIAVSRGNEPLLSLPLEPGYAGKYVKARVQPKHSRCIPGPEAHCISDGPIAESDITTQEVSPNFRNFPLSPNSNPADGMWGVGGKWEIREVEGLDHGYGIHSTDPARLFYQCDTYTGDMQIELALRPDKTAGQVFSVPGSPDDEGERNLHADIFIKYDPRTRTGYSLRFWRTTESSSKCMFQFYRIENGIGHPLDRQQVLSGVLKRDTHLVLGTDGDRLTARASNTSDTETLEMECRIIPNHYGGAGISWPRGASVTISRFAISFPTNQ